MAGIEWWQIILLTLYAAFAIYDGNNTTFGFVKPTMAGFFAGLILGDIQTGLIVGGTLNLLVLGVGNFGGASIPDYMTGALLGTTFAILSGEGAEFGAALAVPIGLLMVQLDVLARFTNTFFQHRAEKLVKEGKTRQAASMNVWGIVPTSLSRMIPVFLALVLGSHFVQNVVNWIPAWFMKGLSVSGGILPALGIAILLRYLPIKPNFAFLLIGFFLAAYLKVPVLGVAIIGVALALIYLQFFANGEKEDKVTPAGGIGDE
ncbi:PTS mannose/fructose/sorbose/N-acetylgalactosamine transporter subunit IIC [Bacillales bacterium AN1005]|uniref:PTS mannose/fructose/sorbose/N-acetylgalactosamine transporter subunit IIC n=1 Tax=Niallia taxi TaxID=2499688 RepID=UPI0021A6D0D2|nr:PTS sugar transporter subunit IIC [Niallia taxi]MCT2346827.1 PTS sugar transporter subunit IIC [Niallia taxi]